MYICIVINDKELITLKKNKMSTSNNIKKFFTVIALIVITLSSKAFVGVKPVFNVNSLQITMKANNTLQINVTLVTKSNETLEIQKSYNNKTFTAVAILFTEDNNATIQSVKITDKIKTEKNVTVYYRVVKVNNETAVKIMSNSIALK